MSPDEAQVKKKKGFEEWEIDNAVSTLIEAEKIKKNKPLLRAARKKMIKQLEATQAAHKATVKV